MKAPITLLLCLLLSLFLSMSAQAQSVEWQKLNKEVTTLYQKGQYDQAIAVAKKALDVAEKEPVPHPPTIATSLNNLALLYKSRGQYPQAESLYKRALAIREKAFGTDHPDVAQSLNNLAGLFDTQGQYAQAEPLYKRSLAIWEKALGADHPDVATSLNNLAGLYQTQGQYLQAESLYKRALAIKEKALGSDHPSLAMSLNNLAELYRIQGQYAQAEPLYKRSLAILEKALGADHPDVAQSLNNLAVLYSRQGRYAQAEPLHKRSLAIREKALGADHPDVAQSLNNLAVLYVTQSQYLQAEPLYKRALAIWEKVLGADHPHVAQSLNNLAGLYDTQGQYAQAEPLHKRALAILEKALGADHPDVAQSLNNLAVLYSRQGQYAQAESPFKRALAIREKVLGAGHPDVALSLNNLAMLYDTQGQYVQAEPLHKRALAIREKALGADHPDVAQSLNNLAMLYSRQGQYAQAEPLYKRALTIVEKALGADHPHMAQSLNNLAELYKRQGQYAQAEPPSKRALAILEKALGAGHPDVAMSLNNLAELYSRQGQYLQSESLFKRALAIKEKALGSDHPSLAMSLNNLAELYSRQGQYAQTGPLYQRSLAIFEKALGTDHPDVAMSLSNLAISFWARGEIERSVDLLQRVNAIREHHLRLLLAKGSEYEKRAYMATIQSDIDAAISLDLATGSRKPGSARLALTTLLQRKGRVLDALADSFGDLRRRLAVEDRLLLDQLSSVNNQRAALYMLARQAKIRLEEYHSQMAKLEEEAQALEARISASSAEFRALAQPITLEGVQQAIPAGAALVEFSLYYPFNPQAKTPRESWGSARYVAYLLWPQGDPVSVDLGEAIIVDRIVGDLRKGLADPSSEFVTRLGRKLDEQVMHPVRRLLGETRTVLLSSDGALNLVPFVALVDEENQYLIRRYAFTYLSSGRDLLRLQTKVASRSPGTLMADVDFGSTRKAIETAQAEQDAAKRRSTDFAAGAFTFFPLPGTALEAQAIAKILPTLKVLSGKQATESALKQLDGPRIVHVATHGFFLPILHQEPLEKTGFQLTGTSLIYAPKTENPLLRSGLALANANQLESGTEDGVLTALEAAGLDLWGTKLVVLSACETGVGEVQNGEGVFGLRRALVIAGSESQVMSLWKVDDHATKDLMVDYYKHLISNKGRSEALRESQLAMLTNQNRSHPFYWASFIPSGNWRPLDRVVPEDKLQ
ncbi:MAG TPA: tetratricopeptide repeat protein [Nitrosospira sp.]|nr:tetratricopeptide repeat protein [Nitrosospira sp.]